MAQRLIEVIVPKGRSHRIPDIMKEHEKLDMWEETLPDDRTNFIILVKAEDVEPILDDLEGQLAWAEGFRVILLPVEASLPRPKEPEEKKKEEEAEEPEKKKRVPLRISREELYNDITEMTDVNTTFLSLIVISAVVAAIGLYTNNVAVIIGAMVIAPMLGPNVAFSLATTLGDRELAFKSQKANLIGISMAVLFAVIMGLIFNVDPTTFEIASRTSAGLPDVLLALASGTAGVLSITVGVATALVGVMVAVALVPPLVTFGLLLAGGYWDLAAGAGMLFLINLICINLSGVMVFMVKGITPRRWWEAEKAKKSARNSMMLWTALLLLLIIAILFSQGAI
ncbi:MAG TPA: TIGR00341 family protein [Methanomassiliicoccales archaeon]|nr:TIGR00341 family protein [Methanomassiliicoccales archaeon]